MIPNQTGKTHTKQCHKHVLIKIIGQSFLEMGDLEHLKWPMEVR